MLRPAGLILRATTQVVPLLARQGVGDACTAAADTAGGAAVAVAIDSGCGGGSVGNKGVFGVGGTLDELDASLASICSAMAAAGSPVCHSSGQG